MPCLPQCGILKPNTGEGEPHTPPQQAPPSEGTLHRLHAKLGDLNDSELQQLIKDLTQEIAQCELTVPPSYPPPNDWVHPSGRREPDRKMTRRSPFQEGEGGVQRGKPPQFQSHWLGEEFPLDHHSNCHVLHQQDQTWGN